MHRLRYTAACETWLHNTTAEQFDDPEFYLRDASRTAEIEELRRTGFTELLLTHEQVRMQEAKLGITERWTEDSPGWQAATREANELQYQWVIDNLEGLVVSRLFELAKMNRAGTSNVLVINVHRQLC